SRPGGRCVPAGQLLKEAFALPAHSALAEFARKQWPEFLLARGRTQEALGQSQLLLQSPSRMGQFAADTLIGRALVAMDRTEEAESELASARSEERRVGKA